ncbi:methyl-accepting chemotaxis protein [Acidovorax sp. NCPPB 2350]|nr:methyl-accepting chemotaxis protein [Acidovorax sp. NCPPB 2350]
MLTNLNIGTRLRLGFGTVIALSCITVGVSLWNLKTMSDASAAMMQKPLLKERLSSDWYRAIDSGIMRTTAIAKSSDPSLAAFLATDGPKRSGDLQEKIRSLLETAEERALFDKIDLQRVRYLDARDRVNKLKAEGRTDEALKLLEAQYLPISKTFQQLMQDLVSVQRDQIDAINADIESTTRRSTRLLLILVSAAILFATLVAHRLTRSIVGPLALAVSVAERVAEGDLTHSIGAQSKDEVGRLMASLGRMNANLLRLISGIRASVNGISLASSEIASGNLDLSARTEQQASSVEETAAATEEIVSTIQRNADSAEKATKTAALASDVASRSGRAVARVVETMDAINASSKRIASIIGVIDGIAFQTNILALNAAVEAARAGEQGRGFAVVASEVRNLAQRSAHASREIKALITDSVDKVALGTTLVKDAGDTIHAVVSSVDQVAQIISDISSSTHQQATGMLQVSASIHLIDDVTQKNAALVEEASAVASSMKEEAAALAGMVGVFRLETDLLDLSPSKKTGEGWRKPLRSADRSGDAA